ncbi:MAG: carbohydrate ABC transporter permease [Chloroflexi bacterium]|nr:MAG: carbohydrate ABC transporter permease [Chloroflexota bacterium]
MTAIRARSWAGSAGFYLVILVILLFSLFPFYWVLITSLKSNTELTQAVHGLWPDHASLNSYNQLFVAGNFLLPLANSVLVAAGATAIALVTGILTAYALVRLAQNARAAVLGFVLAIGFFPVIAMVGPLFFVYRNINFLNSYLSLIITYLIYAIPIGLWILVSIFDEIPKEIEEAATVDGATPLQVLRRIVLPLALPGVFTAAIISFILCWNDFVFALSFMSDPNRYTAPLAIVNLGQSKYQVFYNIIDAGVVATTLPIVILVLIAQRRIVSGLAAGGLKG